MALWQAISNESQTSSIWLVRVPSKPISHENGYHMHFLARNNLKFKFHNKETHRSYSRYNWNITTTAENHRVRYGVRSELCLTLKNKRGVREMWYIVRLDSSRVATRHSSHIPHFDEGWDSTRVKSNYIPHILYIVVSEARQTCGI